MGWFKRIKEGITTATNEKKETPEGLWYKCPKCKTIVTSEQHQKQLIFQFYMKMGDARAARASARIPIFFLNPKI